MKSKMVRKMKRVMRKEGKMLSEMAEDMKDIIDTVRKTRK